LARTEVRYARTDDQPRGEHLASEGTEWTGCDRPRKYHTKTNHGTKKEAEKYLSKVLRDMDTGAFIEPAMMPFNQYLDGWLIGVVGLNRKPKTALTYESVLRIYVRPRLGHRPLAAITTIEIQELYAELRSMGKSVRTVRLIHGALCSAFRNAMETKVLQQSPMIYAKAPAGQTKEMKALTPAQAKCLLAAAEGSPMHSQKLGEAHFKRLLRAADLPEDFRLYDLRHSCATLLLAAGEHPKVVPERPAQHAAPGEREVGAPDLGQLSPQKSSGPVGFILHRPAALFIFTGRLHTRCTHDRPGR
jgi:hypothetical protein